MRRVYLAGIEGSGPGHWQATWYQNDSDGVWVEHHDWSHVACETWVAEMHQLMLTEEAPVILIAHSLGCLLAAEYLAVHGSHRIAGAFLVAPPDPSGSHFPSTATGFRAPESMSFDAPSVIVASSNDHYASLDFAKRLAKHWRSQLVEVGALGHINAASNLGAWPQGVSALQELIPTARLSNA